MSNVISFPASARRARPRADRGRWSAAELAELIRLFGACSRGCGGAATFETGQTDMGDPQFYVVGTGPDLPCIAFASRIGTSGGHIRYLVQDGSGEVIAEGETAAAAIDIAVSTLASRNRLRRIMAYLVRSIAMFLPCGIAREAGWLDDFWIEIADNPLIETLIGYAA
ncbi:MAG TPA: hypothetical protein VGD08_04510 [Stellaceae bacterium]